MSSPSTNDVLTRPRHIPAWKRIGLKLKYAKDSAEDHSSREGTLQSNQVEADSRSKPLRKSTDLFSDDVRPAKRRKRSSKPARDNEDPTVSSVALLNSAESAKELPAIGSEHVRTIAESISVESDHKYDNPSFQQSRNTDDVRLKSGPDRRKSVTFTPETKQDDGFGASSIPQQWSADATTNADSSMRRPPVASTNTKKKKKHPRLKPEDFTSGSQQDESNVLDDLKELPEYVQYLHLFHTDKQSWKFNKNKQNNLLRNLFKVDRLPPQQNAAILEYIAGLQGAAARQRVIESATSVLKSIVEKYTEIDPEQVMESDEARRAAYRAALQRQIEKHERSGASSTEYDDQAFEETKQEIEAGRRADAVLSQLLQQELHPGEAHAEASQTAQEPTPIPDINESPRISTTAAASRSTSNKSKRKKRKSRTQASSNESSSDSDQSEGNFKPSRGPATVHKALKARPNPAPRAPLETASKGKVSTGKKIVFDDELLDKIYPKPQSYHETAPKRKAGEKSKAR